MANQLVYDGELMRQVDEIFARAREFIEAELAARYPLVELSRWRMCCHVYDPGTSTVTFYAFQPDSDAEDDEKSENEQS